MAWSRRCRVEAFGSGPPHSTEFDGGRPARAKLQLRRPETGQPIRFTPKLHMGQVSEQEAHQVDGERQEFIEVRCDIVKGMSGFNIRGAILVKEV